MNRPLMLSLALASLLALPLRAHCEEAYTDAEVRRVDAASGKLTLKHGEIKNLDMPPMTMVFVARDKAALASLKAGDKVRFQAVQEGRDYVVTVIEPLPAKAP